MNKQQVQPQLTQGPYRGLGETFCRLLNNTFKNENSRWQVLHDHDEGEWSKWAFLTLATGIKGGESEEISVAPGYLMDVCFLLLESEFSTGLKITTQPDPARRFLSLNPTQPDTWIVCLNPFSSYTCYHDQTDSRWKFKSNFILN